MTIPADATKNISVSAEAPFYIPAVNLPSRPHRSLKHNDTFAIFDSHGDIGAASGGGDGLFHCDTRYLSHLELLINGAQPLLLGSAIDDNNLSYYVDLTNPDIYSDDRIAVLKDTVHIGRTMYLLDGALHERIVLSNHGADPIRFTLSIAFASDFADIFEVRGVRRRRRGRMWSEAVGRNSIVLCYNGLDDVIRKTSLSFAPEPDSLLESISTYVFELAPSCSRTVFVAARGDFPKPIDSRSFIRGLMTLRRDHKKRTGNITTVETSNSLVNEILCRSMADLSMLSTATTDGRYPYAGIPWYSTTFGRDGIITALQTLWIDPEIAHGVLRRLARFQAANNDPAADAEPGKILHEMREGEMAHLREIPFARYYGSVDSTPLFILLAGAYAVRTGNYGLVKDLWPVIEAALSWIDGPGDPDRDGFVEYRRAASTGLSNQGWKDSFDSVFHSGGELAEGPIALVEVQGYVYAAKRLASHCARRLDMGERAAELEAQAEELRQRFEAAFWCEEIGSYALALDGNKRPCRVRTSNAGHVLFTGIANPGRARRIIAGLFDTRFYSGWGIRTVAQGEARFNPMSYHNGSIWPHDNALIALGMARYSHKQGIGSLFEALVRATSYMEHRRLPELFCGFRRRRGRGPTLYPAACSPQAWASGAPFLLLQAMLGLTFDHGSNRIELVNPSVPESIGSITIKNLALGSGSADFIVRQEDEAISLQVVRATPGLHVSIIFKDTSGGLW